MFLRRLAWKAFRFETKIIVLFIFLADIIYKKKITFQKNMFSLWIKKKEKKR